MGWLAKNLDQEIQLAMNSQGGTVIPLHLERVNDYIEISKGQMILIGGAPTAGKTTAAQDMFIIEPIEWYLKNKPPGMKLSVISFLMERHMKSYTSRWISRWLFQDTGIMIHPKKILGKKEGQKLTQKEYDLIKPYYEKLDKWEEDDLLIAHEGSHNPSGISMYIEAFARKHGTIIEKEKREKKAIKDMTQEDMDNILKKTEYIPNHPNHIILVIADNASVIDAEGELTDRKLVDKFNKTMAKARDTYNMTPVIVQHLGRKVDDVHRQKAEDWAPKLSDFSDTSQTQKSADVVLALINPFSNKAIMDKKYDNGYDIVKFKDNKFRTYYRQLWILKNNFDGENLQFPISMHPIYGMMKTLNRITQEYPADPDIYQQVTTGMWFLSDNKNEPQKAFAGFPKTIPV